MIFNRGLLPHALALSVDQFLGNKKLFRVYVLKKIVRMHLVRLEPTKAILVDTRTTYKVGCFDPPRFAYWYLVPDVFLPSCLYDRRSLVA